MEEDKKIDMNFIQKEDSVVQNCSTGYHKYNVKEVGMNGSESSLKLVCIFCGQVKSSIVENLFPGVNNDASHSSEKPVVSTQEDIEPPKMSSLRNEPVPRWKSEVSERYQSEKASDSFWDAIKRR